jgi:hypothetical protein
MFPAACQSSDTGHVNSDQLQRDIKQYYQRQLFGERRPEND